MSAPLPYCFIMDQRPRWILPALTGPDRLVTASGPLRVRRTFYYLLPYQVVVEAVGSTDLDCSTVSARQQNALCTRYISCIR